MSTSSAIAPAKEPQDPAPRPPKIPPASPLIWVILTVSVTVALALLYAVVLETGAMRAIAAGVLTILVAYALFAWPRWQAARAASAAPPDAPLTAKELWDIENGARDLLAKIAGGLVALITIGVSLDQFRLTQMADRRAADAQNIERFYNAAEKLGAVDEAHHPQIARRIAAIYSLQRLVEADPGASASIAQVLVAYIDKTAHRQFDAATLAAGSRNAVPAKSTACPEQYSVRAALDVLSRLPNGGNPNAPYKVYLPVTNLSRLTLDRLDLALFDLSGADLTRTTFRGCNLERANLAGTTLVGADMRDAKLTGVDFTGADLTDARLARAAGVNKEILLRQGAIITRIVWQETN